MILVLKTMSFLIKKDYKFRLFSNVRTRLCVYNHERLDAKNVVRQQNFALRGIYNASMLGE